MVRPCVGKTKPVFEAKWLAGGIPGWPVLVFELLSTVWEIPQVSTSGTAHKVLVLSCLLTLYTAVMSFEILFPFGLWVFEPGWLLDHSQLV